ncbi:MAG: ATP-binding protein [Sphingobacteriaceae bacterium]
MDKLFEKYYQKLDAISLNFQRSLLDNIDWSNRFIGIKGARGAGKTTLLFQYIHKHNLPKNNQTLYVSLDDLYFTENKLVNLADRFVKEGGKYLLLDEVHRYPNWSAELKNIYDDHAGLNLVFTGSSLIHIEKAKGDLSRRAVMYELFGLSFREFLHFRQGVHFDKIELDELLTNHVSIARKIVKEIKPLAYFKDYLQLGHYPYFLENEKAYAQKLAETIALALSTDLPAAYDLNYGSIEKIRLLLHILADSVPFKPNISKLSERIGITRNTLLEFLKYLEEMRIVRRLYASTHGIGILQKPEKLYLYHPNLHYALSYQSSDIGNIRESFFISQVSPIHLVTYATDGDFKLGKHTFEVGGKGKTDKQIKSIDDAFVAADNIEIGHNNKIPLWLFGFLY